MPSLNALLATALLAFTSYNIHAGPGLGTITLRLSQFAFAAWVFAIYGDGLAEIVGLSSTLVGVEVYRPVRAGARLVRSNRFRAGHQRAALAVVRVIDVMIFCRR